MGLFGKRKSEPQQHSCGCDGSAVKTESTCCGEAVGSICCIKVLCAGCKSCHEQYENAKAAVVKLGLNIEVGYDAGKKYPESSATLL